MTINLDDPETRRQLALTDTVHVRQVAQYGELGVETGARTLAETLCTALHATTWDATVRTPSVPCEHVDQQDSTTVEIGGQLTIVVTRTKPARRPFSGERWTINVNGTAIPHRPVRGEIVHSAAAITRSVWLYLSDVAQDPCDSLGCPKPATVATWTSSRCTGHADRTAS